MNARDDVLRAAVYAAIDAQDTDGYRAALERIVFVHRTWPLIEYAHALELAADVEREEEAELLAWYASIGYGADDELAVGCALEDVDRRERQLRRLLGEKAAA